MRVAVPFDTSRDIVRGRLKSRSHEIAEHIPGGMAEVATSWPSENQMNMTVRAMGQDLHGVVDIEENQLVFEIALPGALAFIEPMIAGAIQKQGQKLISKD